MKQPADDLFKLNFLGPFWGHKLRVHKLSPTSWGVIFTHGTELASASFCGERLRNSTSTVWLKVDHFGKQNYVGRKKEQRVIMGNLVYSIYTV